jgi:WD40 repeat protein
MTIFFRKRRSFVQPHARKATSSRSLKVLPLFAATLTGGALAADEAGLPVVAPAAEVQVVFNAHVLPLLRTHCLACHSASVKEGDLSLESAEAIRTGGTSGPAIVAGDADESLLFRSASHRAKPVMPPADNDANATDLSPEELGLVKAWIDQGAKSGAPEAGGAVVWQALDATYGPIFAADISTDGRYAAAARGNRVLLFDVISKREIGRLEDPALAATDLYHGAGVADLDAVQSLAFSRDGARIATGGFRTVRIWKREEGAELRSFATVQIQTDAVAFSPAGRLAAIVGADGSLRLFDFEANAFHAPFGTKAVGATCAAFSLDGSKLVAGTGEGAVVFSLADGSEVAKMTSISPVRTVSLDSDGSSVLAGGVDGTLRVGDAAALATNAAPVELPGHQGPVIAVRGVPGDANAALSAGGDGTARLWNLSGKAQIRQFDHGAPLVSLAVSPDGKRLATAAVDGAVVFWNVETGARIADASRDSFDRIREAELSYAIEVAKLRERTAKADLDAAVKRERDESAVADAGELFAAETRLAARRKTADAEKPVAEKVAAEKASAEALTAFETAEAAKILAEKTKLAATEALAAARAQRDAGALDETAFKAAEDAEKIAVDAEKQAVAALAEATKKRDEAKREADRLRPIAQKAIDERTVAEGGALTAAREAGVARRIAEATKAGLPTIEAEWNRLVDERRGREAELATFLALADARKERLKERTNAVSGALGQVATLRERVRTSPVQPVEPAAETLAARTKAQADLETAAGSLEERLQALWTASVDERSSFDQGAAAKRAAEEASNRASELVQAATARKEAAEKALTEAQAKLAAATTEDDKEFRQLAVTIAQRNATAAEQALTEASNAKTAVEAKREEEGRLSESANAGKTRAIEEAAAALAAAKTAYETARTAALAADEAAGGVQAALATIDQTLMSARERLAEERPAIRDIAFSASGDRAAVVDDAGEVRTFHVETGAPLMQFAVEGASPLRIAFDAKDDLILACSEGSLGTFASDPVWRLERTIGSPDSSEALVDRVTALEFDPSGALLATGGGEPSRSGELKLWNVETGELARDFAGAHSDAVFDVSFSSDGAAIASCGADRFVKTFDVATGEVLRSLEGHSHHVLSVDWRADDRLLATGSADQTIKIWDVRLGEQIRTIQGLTKEANSLRFLGATDEFAVAVGDFQIVNRNVGGGAGATYLTPSDFTYVVRATADGKFVLAGGQDGTLRAWDRTAKLSVEFAPVAAKP